MRFPSAEWFAALAAAANEDRAELVRLGFCNLRLELRINGGPDGDRHFGLVLDGYDVESAGEVDPVAWGPDCTLEGPWFTWTEMIDNISANDGADLSHTLNALTLPEVPMRVTADDPMGRDLFFRYNESLQAIFDRAARVPTELAEVGAG